MNDSIAQDPLESAFEAIRAYAAVQLCNAGKIAGSAAVGAIESAKEISLWLLSIRPKIAEVKRVIRMNILDENKLKAAPPESQAQALLAIMETKEDEDYDAILNVLRAAKTEHELKWILRKISQMQLPAKEDPEYAKASGEALQEGIRRIVIFGKSEDGFDKLIYSLLNKNGIKYEQL